jgi:hypothetical protein
VIAELVYLLPFKSVWAAKTDRVGTANTIHSRDASSGFFHLKQKCNNLMEQTPYLQADNRIARRFSLFFGTVYFIRIYHPAVNSILSQFNALQHITSYFVTCILILSSHIYLRLPIGIFLLRFRLNSGFAFFISTFSAT